MAEGDGLLNSQEWWTVVVAPHCGNRTDGALQSPVAHSVALRRVREFQGWFWLLLRAVQHQGRSLQLPEPNFSETDDNDNFEGRMLELTKTVSANSKSLKVVGLLIIL